MKKFLSILSLVVFLLGTTPLVEVLKFPLLIQHFGEHQKEDKELGFFEFLAMHYLNGDPIDDDYEQDMKLPFKTISTEHSIIALTFGNGNQSTFQFLALPVEVHSQSFQEESLLPSQYLDAIWQPPRLS